MTKNLSETQRYDEVAAAAAAVVIGHYSTSFSLATRLFGPRVRSHVRNIYALVRIADEIVDGPGRGATADAAALRTMIDALEKETLSAVASGFSTDLIVHAFAHTARECGINEGLIRPFFESMRTDIDVTVHDASSHERYVYGSAEVVGLMCLQVFLNAGRPRTGSAPAHLTAGARRLGAAFQDINFLRDSVHDRRVLGRDYLGGDDPAARDEVMRRIRQDLNSAARVIPDLPRDCRKAVILAHQLFSVLAKRIETHPSERASVPTRVKILIAIRTLLGAKASEVPA